MSPFSLRCSPTQSRSLSDFSMILDNPRETESPNPRRFSRRRIFTLGIGACTAVLVAGVAGVELISHGALPGQQELDQIEGGCSVASPPLRFSGLGRSVSGSFYSETRHRTVGYMVAWPPRVEIGTPLPLVIMLHGEGANHSNALTGMTPGEAVALEIAGQTLPPMAIVTVDGGDGYWNPHPEDNPIEMVASELIPMCQRMNLGERPQKIGAMGISMGGYGALLIAEKYPDLIGAVAAISPAIWTSYEQARAVNSAAYASAADFAEDDAVTHASALTRTPVRVASGNDDPFHPGVVALARALPATAEVEFSQGCHTGSFFTAQEPPSLQFLGKHLATLD
jgi:enterochelin esterase-like enzyme